MITDYVHIYGEQIIPEHTTWESKKMGKVIKYTTDGCEYTGTADEDREMTEEEAGYVYVPTRNDVGMQMCGLRLEIWKHIFEMLCNTPDSNEMERHFKLACKLIFDEGRDDKTET